MWLVISVLFYHVMITCNVVVVTQYSAQHVHYETVM